MQTFSLSDTGPSLLGVLPNSRNCESGHVFIMVPNILRDARNTPLVRAGKDATNIFESFHKGDALSHAASLLDDMYIGDLDPDDKMTVGDISTIEVSTSVAAAPVPAITAAGSLTTGSTLGCLGRSLSTTFPVVAGGGQAPGGARPLGAGV